MNKGIFMKKSIHLLLIVALGIIANVTYADSSYEFKKDKGLLQLKGTVAKSFYELILEK